MVPSGNALVGIADRAGYPVLTVPAGYGTGGAGRNPIGVTFVGAAFSEAKLLAAGYAYRAGDERAARAELDEPEHVALRAGQHVLLAAPLPPGRPRRATPPPGRPRRRWPWTSAAPCPPRSSLSVSGPISFGAFTPGLPKLYLASASATVTSTAGEAALTVSDPSSTATGRLVNGALRAAAAAEGRPARRQRRRTRRSAAATARRRCSATRGRSATTPCRSRSSRRSAPNDGLRTGTYRKTLVLTLSTTQP